MVVVVVQDSFPNYRGRRVDILHDQSSSARFRFNLSGVRIPAVEDVERLSVQLDFWVPGLEGGHDSLMRMTLSIGSSGALRRGHQEHATGSDEDKDDEWKTTYTSTTDHYFVQEEVCMTV